MKYCSIGFYCSGEQEEDKNHGNHGNNNNNNSYCNINIVIVTVTIFFRLFRVTEREKRHSALFRAFLFSAIYRALVV
jgi:hypothetical protein